ncbi:TPA: hypothetical protein ACH3X2_001960 [Trebouxia sp. C0005]
MPESTEVSVSNVWYTVHCFLSYFAVAGTLLKQNMTCCCCHLCNSAWAHPDSSEVITANTKMAFLKNFARYSIQLDHVYSSTHPTTNAASGSRQRFNLAIGTSCTWQCSGSVPDFVANCIPGRAADSSPHTGSNPT